MRIDSVLKGASLALVLLGLVAAGHAVPADPPANACPVGGHSGISCPVLNDEVIQQAVTLRLSGSVVTPWTRVTVMVQDGVVTLCGSVDSESQRDLGTLLAGTVRGVTAVRNQLHIAPAEQGDLATIRAIKREFARQSFPLNGVVVDSRNGVVALSGMVDGDWVREQAGLIAENIPGVVAVHNGIVVGGPGDYMF